MAKLFRVYVVTALFLAGCFLMTPVARCQDPSHPMPFNKEQPLKPGQDRPPDLFTKYKSDPEMLRAMRAQTRLRAEQRQKLIVSSTDLLLKIAQDLRNEIASEPSAGAPASEKERLEQIQKLARVIQMREKAEDDISSDLAKAGVSQ